MNPLTSRERLDRCFKHQEMDRPGLFLRGVTATSPRHPSYQPLRDLGVAKGDLKAGWSVGQLIESPPTSTCTEPYSEDFERRITVLHTPMGDLRAAHLIGLKGQPGLHEKFLLETVEDVEKVLSLPPPKIQGEVCSFFHLDREMGDRGIVEVGLGLNPAGTVADLLGSERFALFSIEHRDLLHALVEQRLNTILRALHYVLERGVGPYFAFLGQEYITPPLHGPRDFYDFNVRYDKPITDTIHEARGFVHVHSHGPLKDVLSGFIELGADVLHPIEAPPMGNVTPKEAKTVLRDHVCIEGNIQIGDMYEKNASEIRAMAEVLITDAFDDHRDLIVCPTASPYVPEMSQRVYENYATLVEVVTQWTASSR